MLKILKIVIIGALLASPAASHAASTGLYMNDDGIQVRHIRDPIPEPLFEYDIRQTYNFLYSQETVPRSFLLGAELELPDLGWELSENQKLVPRIDPMLLQFKGYNIFAVAVGATHRLILNEEHTFNLETGMTMAPPLTTFASGKLLWSFKTQLNYPFTDDVEFNVGYRTLVAELLNNDRDGFERGVYFGITKFLE